MSILKHASENPDDCTIGDINSKMKALQMELGVKPSRKPSADSIKLNFMKTSLMLVNWTDEDYKSFGVTKVETLGWWDNYRADLVSRGVLPEDELDPAVFCPPWKSTPEIEVEVVKPEE
jgi:hypothetical protein